MDEFEDVIRAIREEKERQERLLKQRRNSQDVGIQYVQKTVIPFFEDLKRWVGGATGYRITLKCDEAGCQARITPSHQDPFVYRIRVAVIEDSGSDDGKVAVNRENLFSQRWEHDSLLDDAKDELGTSFALEGLPTRGALIRDFTQVMTAYIKASPVTSPPPPERYR